MNTQEEVWILKREVAQLKRELDKFKNAVLLLPDIGDRVQKNIWFNS
tara:strand:+ start:621 stop:761 length:141 start_codon:yes stop_codon:yes gene_type:complete